MVVLSSDAILRGTGKVGGQVPQAATVWADTEEEYMECSCFQSCPHSTYLVLSLPSSLLELWEGQKGASLSSYQGIELNINPGAKYHVGP